jgi:hypoxanthine phosphoribosyltransferase
VIQLHDKHFVPFITAEEIEAVVTRMARQAEEDLKGEIPVFIGVLNGSFMVVSDFLKKYSHPCEVSFVKLSSYEGTASTNEVKKLIGLSQSLEGRSVVVIEDIVDTGNTVAELKMILEGHNVKQLKIATLFFKPEAYKQDITLDYVGFEIPDKFIVGYGLDYDELGRNLPEVYQLHENK